MISATDNQESEGGRGRISNVEFAIPIAAIVLSCSKPIAVWAMSGTLNLSELGWLEWVLIAVGLGTAVIVFAAPDRTVMAQAGSNPMVRKVGMAVAAVFLFYAAARMLVRCRLDPQDEAAVLLARSVAENVGSACALGSVGFFILLWSIATTGRRHR